MASNSYSRFSNRVYHLRIISTMLPSNRQNRGVRSYTHAPFTCIHRGDRPLYEEVAAPGGFTRYEYLLNRDRLQSLLDTARFTRSRPTQDQLDFEPLWDNGVYLGPSQTPTLPTIYTMDTEDVATPINLHECGPSAAAAKGEEGEVTQPDNSTEASTPTRPPRTLDLGLVFSAIVEIEEELKLLRECFDEFFGDAERIGTIHLPY